MEQTKYDVFISYSRKDYVRDDVVIPGNPITAIQEMFDQNGINYWFDKDGIYGGQEFVEVISDAIASSKMLVFVSSKHSNVSKWTAGEIFEAHDGDKLIIPVRIDDSPYNKKFRLLVRPLNYVDYQEQPNTALSKLLLTVKKEKERIEKIEADSTIEAAKEEIKEKAKEYLALEGQHDYILKLQKENERLKEKNDEIEKRYKELERKRKEIEEIKIQEEAKRKAEEEMRGIFTVNGVSFKMIRVEGGTFMMGATSEQGSDAYDDEKPVHQVTLSDYFIGETQVTQELWQAVMGSNPSRFEGSNRPVERVSWNDCKGFISKLNKLTGKRFRLPTEAEWEYAARGGKRSNGCKYAGSNDIDAVAWYLGNSGDETHPVGQKQPNELGLYDMSGNVWEWCQDRHCAYSSYAQTNPTGPVRGGTYDVLRGGGWPSGARLCRLSRRGSNAYSISNSYIGLRLAL